MRIQVRSTNIPMSIETQREIERRCRLSLDHLHGQVAQVLFHLSDLNGPRGGHDKRCRISIRLADGATVMIRATEPDEFRAVASALEKAKHRLNEHLKKRRRSRKGGHTIRRSAALESPHTRDVSPGDDEPWWIDDEAEHQAGQVVVS